MARVWILLLFLVAAGTARADTAGDFIAAEGFRALDPATEEAVLGRLLPALDAGRGGAPDGELGPLVKAVVLATNLDPRPAHFERWRLVVEGRRDGGLDLVTLRLINLGPAIHRENALAYGVENVAPASRFGTWPDASFRLAFAAVPGQAAQLVAVSRRIDGAGRSRGCPLGACTSTLPDGDQWDDWQDAPLPMPGRFPLPRQETGEQVPSPALTAQILSLLAGFHTLVNGEARFAAMAPVPLTLIIEKGLGQEESITGLLGVTRANDPLLREVWYRLDAVGTQVSTSRRFVYR